MLTVGSFCTGYGGLDLAVENHFGAETIWHSEIDKNANQLLATRFPEVPNLGNLKEINWAETPPVDILCAGYPCQPFSVAGNRKGETDERAIFSYIAESISVLRPRWVVLENVAGHLTLGGTGVVGSLTSMGYDCRWGVVRASDAGAPHRRARWFCIATDSTRRGGLGGRKDGRRIRRMGSTAENSGREASTAREKPIGGNETPTDTPGWFRAVPKVDHPGRKPPPPRRSDSQNGSDADTSSPGLERHREEHGLRETSEQIKTNWGDYDAAIKRWEETIGRAAPTPTNDKGLAPAFVEWMMGLPEGWVTGLGLSRNAELKMLGNGVVPQQAALALSILGADLTTK